MAYLISVKKWDGKVLVMLIVLFATIMSISGNGLNQFHPLANIIAEANKQVAHAVKPTSTRSYVRMGGLFISRLMNNAISSLYCNFVKLDVNM